MEQSQKPAEPLKPIKPAQFIKEFVIPEATDASESPEALENRQRAAREISMIFELKDLTAFKWFVEEFVNRPFQEAFDKLRDPKLREKDETLENIQQRYIALRSVRVGMLEREIAHREQITPNDTQIPILREELRRL